MKRITVGIIFFTFTFFVSDLSYAEKNKKKSNNDGDKEKVSYEYKKETVVEFSEVELEGAFQKPEGYYSLKAKKTKFETLITPKYDFMDELKNSVYTIDED